MVFFICNGCGSSLKKNNVEKHQAHQCRKSGHLSCMDCSKDFYGDEYKAHVKCISEEEKYSAKGWTAKPNQNKNERKQNEWVSMVQELASSVDKSDPALSRVLQTISQHENIPRKKAKFLNFLKNIFGPRSNPKVADLAWDLMSKALDELREKALKEQQLAKELKEKELNAKAESESQEPQNGCKHKKEAENEVKGGKKRKREEENDKEQNGQIARVKWCTIGKTILRSQEDKELSLKKFQKKIVPEYINRMGNGISDTSVEILWSKCLKKLSKNPKFKIHKEHIKLLS